MANLEFSVPYNNDPKTLEEIFELKRLGNNSITEVYLAGPQKYSGTGREPPEIRMEDFINIVDKIHGEGLRVNLLLNSTCEGSEWYTAEVVRPKMEYLRQVHKEYGVEAVTIANPIYIREVRRQFPDIEICASVLGDIDCVQRAVVFAEAGANVLTPDVNINRNLKLLKEIKAITGTELKLMVNEGCLYKCPFRKFHFNRMSHVSKEAGIEGAFFFAYCGGVIGEDSTQFLKSGWIRPEDTSKYGEITSYFKIVGRTMPSSKVIRCVRAYMEESWDGDLMDIMCGGLGNFALRYGSYLNNKSLDENRFFEKVTSCDENCSQCKYCEELAKELVGIIGFTEEKIEDKDLKDFIDDLGNKGVITDQFP